MAMAILLLCHTVGLQFNLLCVAKKIGLSIFKCWEDTRAGYTLSSVAVSVFVKLTHINAYEDKQVDANCRVTNMDR